MEGERIGAYRLLETLGTGFSATVWLAEAVEDAGEVSPGTRVALKLFHPHILTREDFLPRFLREVESGRNVRHENVVRIIDAGTGPLSREGETLHYLVMDYVSGQTLRELLDDQGGVAEGLCRHIGREVAQALDSVHRAGMVHRDVKPENILITKDEVVKLMDLGTARVRDEAFRVSRTGDFSGTVLYAAPEQFRRGEDVDGRTDLYGLGLVLYELATGVHPFPARTMSEALARHLNEKPRRPGARNPRISAFLEEAILTLLAKRRSDRFSSAGELAEVLAAGEDGDWWSARRGRIRTAPGAPLRRMRIPRETSLHGRDGELARLRGMWEEAKGGEGRVALLRGEAGIGKSRLMDEFAAALHGEGEDLHFLFGAFPPGAATAVSSLSTAVVDHFGPGRLEEELRGRLGPLRDLAESFSARLRGEPAPREAKLLSKETLQTLFLTVLRSLAGEKPTILLLDDLHFAPGEGLALFASIAHGVPGHRLLVVGTCRPDLSKEWMMALERFDHVERVEVDRVGRRDLIVLLEEALGSGKLANEVGARIAVKSDGNPFFVFEILSGLREAGKIRRDGKGVWWRVGDVSHFRIPDTIRDLLMARVADLADEDRDLLDAAACCGFEFDPLLVAEALERGRVPVLKDLSRLERVRRLVRSSGRTFAFDHHQLRDALYEDLSDLLRRAYHGALADALASRWPDGSEPRGRAAYELTTQYLAGEREHDALPLLHPALDYLEEGYATEEAIELARRFLECPGLLQAGDRARLLLRKGRWLNLIGRWDEQAEVLREAVAAAEAAGEAPPQVDALIATGYLEIMRARYDVARGHLLEARRTAETIGARRQQGAIAGALGILESRRGDFTAARKMHEAHLEIAREEGAAEEEAKASGNLAHLLWKTGSYDESNRRYVHALQLFRETGNRRGEAQVTGNLGALQFELGRYEEAREHWIRQLDIARETGFRRAEIMASGNLGGVLRAMGRFAEARTAYERELELSAEMGDRSGRAETLGHLGVLEFSCGRFERARELWEEALAVFREVGDRHWEAWGLLWIGQIAEGERKIEEATRRGEEALEIFRTIGARPGEADTLLLLGRIRAREGENEAAREPFLKARRIGEETGIPGAIVRATSWLAALPGGDPKPALDAIGEHGGRMDRRELLEARYTIYRATGDRLHLRAARRLLDSFGEHAPEGGWDAMMAVPLHREILSADDERSGNPEKG